MDNVYPLFFYVEVFGCVCVCVCACVQIGGTARHITLFKKKKIEG